MRDAVVALTAGVAVVRGFHDLVRVRRRVGVVGPGGRRVEARNDESEREQGRKPPPAPPRREVRKPTATSCLSLLHVPPFECASV